MRFARFAGSEEATLDFFSRDSENRTRKIAYFLGVLYLAIVLGLVGFGIWVSIVVLRYFGVI